MKNCAINMLSCLLLYCSAGGVLLLCVGCDESKYPSGKDTVESFGDGHFQIMRGTDDGRTSLGLHDLAAGGWCIVDDIIDYKQSGDLVYLTGLANYCPTNVQYTILNIQSASHVTYDTNDKIPPQYQSTFNNLRDTYTFEHEFTRRYSSGRYRVLMPAGDKHCYLVDTQQGQKILEKVKAYVELLNNVPAPNTRCMLTGWDKDGNFVYVVLDDEKSHYKVYLKWENIPEIYQGDFKGYDMYEDKPSQSE